MIRRPVLLSLLVAVSVAAAETKPLTVKVFTASSEGFQVTSTLVAGEKDAILIDGQFALADAHRVVAMVLESRKNLTTIYVTHGHPDHYFGLVALHQAFPKAKLVALQGTVNDVKHTWKEKVKQWGPMYGPNLTTQPVLPEALKGNTLSLEGQTLEVVPTQGDDERNSYVWIPSLKTIVAGDIVYNGVHVWTAETTPMTRKQWLASLDKLAALSPTVVVAGHQQPDAEATPAAIEFTKSYLTAFDEALASSKNAEELQTKMKAKFPKLGLDIVLKIGAEAAFKTTPAAH